MNFHSIATYTYTIRLGILRNDDEILKYRPSLQNSASPRTSHLFETVHDALDRMVMQSDIRDIYHGVRVIGFAPMTNNTSMNEDVGIDTEFYLQLSDNSHDEMHLVDVFRKYLQHHNYSLGGTKIYSSRQFMGPMKATGIWRWRKCMRHSNILLMHSFFFPQISMNA